jgi:hypothetical protein
MTHEHDWTISGWTNDKTRHVIQWKCKSDGCPHYDTRMELTGYTWTTVSKPRVVDA